MNATSRADGRRYLPTGDTCFVCGALNPCGLHARFYTYGDGEAHVDFTPQDRFTGYQEVVHGGVISTILDEIMGWSVSLVIDRFTVTGELTTRYHKPLPPGRTYHIRARAVEDKKRYWIAEGEVRDEEGTLYARGQGKFFPVSEEETKRVAGQLTYQPGDLPIFLD